MPKSTSIRSGDCKNFPKIESVAKLRKYISSRELKVKAFPGIYCWWFPKAEANKLLSHFKACYHTTGRSLQTLTIQRKVYIALYIGVSCNLQRRIHWHINGPFKSSTLRRTLRAIIAPKADEKTAEQMVNHLIDSCYWEWDYIETTALAKTCEKKKLNQSNFTYPLNIINNHTVPKAWITELKSLRRKSKEQ